MAFPPPHRCGLGRLGRLLLADVAGPALAAFVLFALAGGFLEAALLVLRAPVVPGPGALLDGVLGGMPALLVLWLPLAFLVGIAVATGRWASDGTWTALSAAGVPARRLLPALLLAGTCLAAGSAFTAHLVAPAGRRAAARSLALAASDVRLVPGRFVPVKDAVIHRGLDGDLFFASGDLAALARSGGLSAEDDRVVVTLDHGLLQGPAGFRASFERARLWIDLPRPGRRVEIEERSDREILDLVARMQARGQDPSHESAVLWKRSTIPLICLLLPFVALPLGLRWKGRPAQIMVVGVAAWSLVRIGDASCRVIGPPAAATLPLVGLSLLAVALWTGWRDR
ncbi:MAG: LptF/LptG family permease [Deltaproteobacteria bacterium]|nr:LptF/LptG family permease [Deltaproteobacteria bacterium]